MVEDDKNKNSDQSSQYDNLKGLLFDPSQIAGAVSKEIRKRKREIIIVFILSVIFVFLTWFEIRLFSTSQQLPFVHSIFFFGLVNFNIIILLLLVFLIFRNIMKVFVERRSGIFGSSLKAKLIASFVSFSAIPTFLIFIISVFYINSSFDKWFSVKMVGVLKSSLEVQNFYYFNEKKKNYHFAHEVSRHIRNMNDRKTMLKKIKSLQQEYLVDAIEFYPGIFGERILSTLENAQVDEIPKVSLDFLQKGVKNQVESSTIHQFGEGNLVRVIVPLQEGSEKGAIVVSSFVPLSLISRMNDVASAYDEFRDINPLEYPLKSIYLIILFLITLVILMAAIWFGFHLAKQLSIPLVQLGKATSLISKGEYTQISVNTGSEEMAQLVSSFNRMTSQLEKSVNEARSANNSLYETLTYIEVVLKNVSAGVISVDKSGRITTINQHAAKLLKIKEHEYINKSVRELLTLEHFKIFSDLLKQMNTFKMESIQKEFQVNLNGETLPLMISLSLLKDENNQEIGKILVFDDLTPIVTAQRSQAWTEVARRIAHEIKNPLTPIKLSAERLQRKFAAEISDPAFQECTVMIVNQVDQMKKLVNEFSQFARLPQRIPSLGSLNKVIESALKLFKSAHPHIQFLEYYNPDIPEFSFDHEQIQRVIVNLVDNSIAALPKDREGVIQINTDFNRELRIAKIIVSDNGTGIPSQQMARIFEPYFSTKETGSGLGLAIVKRTIEDHNGFIRVSPNSPHGTKMIIEFPI
ncbi:MAG: PAS domain-containing protein [Bdellovibrionaceae bacterium]|nr:PAS domain-containing protein [Pseudobdellovibrionaceae bacterium]